MSFKLSEVSDLLVKCHRRCCICYRYCGIKIETDHIEPLGEDGPDDIDNCLPVCFECHAEIHSYNDKHPRGRKFRPDELKAHRDQWLEICASRPEVFTEPSRERDVGPLQALIDELEFDCEIARRSDGEGVGCLFLDEQFRRAVRFGAISIVQPELKQAIIEAYVLMGKANRRLLAWANAANQSDKIVIHEEVIREVAEAAPKVVNAHQELLKFLSMPKD
jgi:hypothetical protein